MQRLTRLVLAAVALGVLAGAQSQDRPDLQLKAAVYKETVEGDLQGAIALYKQIVANAAAPRPVAAAALLGLGGCYEKVGEAQAREARKVYERLVAEFSDQAQEAASARTRLAALAGTAGVAGGSTMAVRRVWAGPGVDAMGQVSPDGRFLTFTDWDTGDLAVHDLATGENRRITRKGSWWPSGEYAEFSVVSADGRQIAYNWYNKDGFYDLRIVEIDGVSREWCTATERTSPTSGRSGGHPTACTSLRISARPRAHRADVGASRRRRPHDCYGHRGRPTRGRCSHLMDGTLRYALEGEHLSIRRGGGQGIPSYPGPV